MNGWIDAKATRAESRVHLALSTVPSRRTRVVLVFLTGLFVALGAELLIVGMIQLGIGLDFGIYHDRAADFVSGNGFYLPRQLAGPYDLQNGDSLYPPPSLLLFVPFLWLPSALWWVISLGIIAGVVIYFRPSIWVWPLLAFCTIAGNGFASTIQKGNPTMWVGAALAIATIWRPAAVLVLLKPSLFPFALFGSHQRGWWVAFGVLALVCLAFAPMWPDYVRVLADARGRGWEYSASEVPFLVIPLIAWVGRSRHTRESKGSAAGQPQVLVGLR